MDDSVDPGLLRRIDQPRSPPRPAAERIRTSMLAAYDAERESQLQQRAEAENLLDLERPSKTRQHDDRAFFRVFLVAAAAAIVLTVGYIVRQPPPEGQDPVGGVVQQWCGREMSAAMSDIVDFHEEPGGERTANALRRLEELAQDLAGIAVDHGQGLDPELAAELQGLPTVAADARRATTSAQADSEQAIARLAEQLADAVDRLPNGSSCDTNALRGTGSS